ncbi:hypothetical protein LIER_02153 [Lithospermum erythrorhizon]|uniref:Uncharacterized protein n=1 Tax=Lithospermum erythrorhizon TaxID=34254 RepID=A0AAV3NSY8_LITER
MIPPPSSLVIPMISGSPPQATEESQANDDVESQAEDATGVPVGQSSSLGKRPISSVPPKKPLFAKKKKKIAPPPSPPSETMDIIGGPILVEGSDSAPAAKLGYSANYLPLPYTLPGGLVINDSSDLQSNREVFMAVRLATGVNVQVGNCGEFPNR